MKGYIFFISIMVTSLLFVVGCGPSSGSGDEGTIPVITIIGDNPVEIEINTVYKDAGATATDAEDGDLTGVIVTTGDVIDTSVADSHTVTYTVEDSDGNVVTATRTVDVVVDAFPVLSYVSPTVIVVGSVFDPLADVTASDEEDDDNTLVIKIDSNNVDEDTVGDYTVTYSVTDSADNTTTGTRIVKVILVPVPPVEPGSEIAGSALGCTPSNTDNNVSNDVGDDANETVALEPFKKNITSPNTDDLESRSLQTSHTDLKRLSMVVPETTADGTLTGALNDDGNVTKNHPIAVIYLEYVVGSDYEMGDGSADIGDPENLDQVKVSLSRDNGQSWRDYNISNSTEKSSIEVVWGLNDDTDTIAYPGDAQKPKMAVSGNNIVVAWNDKWCPSGNPFGLDAVVDGVVVDPQITDGNITYPDDALAVNGPQGFIDYRGTLAGDDGTEAPNGKNVYQVPFSCVWTARGVIDDRTGDIEWHAPMQLTSGTRDSNHIWVEGSPAGFAMAWQEDTAGLKAGEGAGPGEGWSGATGNRGTDIWYTSIKAGDFNATSGEVDGKPKSENNFHYPVRITDNEQCQATDKKIYCDYFCTNYGTVTSPKGNQSGDVTRCLTYDTDMLTDTTSILDGDSGASRSALKILKTDSIPDEYVVVLGYEETKALKVRVSGEGEQDQGEIPTDIALEGKSVYFESFDFDAINAFDHADISTIATTPMPIVSAGNIINVKVPREGSTGTEDMIFENARRLVIGTQIDSCDANETEDMTFAILYKQSFEVQGASSDMFVRVNYGLTYNSFDTLTDANYGAPLDVTNVSAQVPTTAGNPVDYIVDWSAENLDDNTYENNRENTFSPRIFLRGNNIYIGYAYTPYETIDGEKLPEGGLFPSNFHTNLYVDGKWTGPVNIAQVTDSSMTTLDPRFFTTPKGSFDTTGLESDKSNPNVLFVTWGTAIKEADGMKEADLFFKRSTDNGVTWEDTLILSNISRTIIEEKEVNSFASPDGKHIYNTWLQQSETEPSVDDKTTGLDSWFGRVDFNITAP